LRAAYLLTLVALTSAGAYVVGRRRSGVRASGLRAALVRLLEWAGFWLMFYAANLALGFAAILVIRRITGTAVSLYVNTDATLATLSALQATAWQWWRAEGGRSGSAGP
jgi:hypothetical protein